MAATLGLGAAAGGAVAVALGPVVATGQFLNSTSAGQGREMLDGGFSRRQPEQGQPTWDLACSRIWMRVPP